MTPPPDISKTDRIPELRNELPKKYPETKRDADEWEKHRKKMKSDQNDDQKSSDEDEEKKTSQKQKEEKSDDHELGKDPNLGEEVDFKA